MYTCRECESEINQATEICPHCGADLTAPVPGAEVPEPRARLRKTLVRWGVLLAFLLGAIWGFLWFIVPGRQGSNPTAQAEARAVQALREVGALLGQYASAKDGAYPQQLEALGESVRTAARLAQSVNYQIQYTPGPPQADGTIRSYILQARAGNYGFRNYFTDESRVVRATRENRAATSQDLPL
jgi:hypothetical protein